MVSGDNAKGDTSGEQRAAEVDHPFRGSTARDRAGCRGPMRGRR